MGDVDQLVSDFGGQIVGGVVIVYEDGTNKEAARCIEGTWVTSEEFRTRIADAAVAAASKTLKLPK